MNLVMNSKDAITDKGKIIIQTRNEEISEEYVKLNLGSKVGKFVRLSISDTGKGIDNSIKDRIYEPFFTTKGLGKGTGLGLPTVYNIVKQHQGFMNFTSEPNKLTTFNIFLPLFIDKTDISFTGKELNKYMRGNAENILVVEDEEGLLSFISEILNQNNYSVYKSRSSKDALNTFIAEKGKIDLVFCDLVLPDEYGISLLNKFIAIKPDIKVIVTTGYIDDNNVWNFIRENNFKFIPKPYTEKEVLEMIKNILSPEDIQKI